MLVRVLRGSPDPLTSKSETMRLQWAFRVEQLTSCCRSQQSASSSAAM